MHKDTRNLIWSLLVGIGIASLAGMVMVKVQINDIKRANDANSIHWTSFEVASWDSVYKTQKVARVVLGLRKDGVVIWKEEKLSDWKESSCLFFEPNNPVKLTH